MDIKPIRAEDEYKSALRQASAFFDNQPEQGYSYGDRQLAANQRHSHP